VAQRALASARVRGLLADVVFAGDGRIAAENVVRTPSDDELHDLYAGALAVVHPAHLEGFGFPPIEGLLHGTPAIVADLPVYDETIGPGALRFAPGDAEALADQMLRLADDPELRSTLVAEGRLAVQQLSWQTAARQTHTVLQQAAR
jgi:glycosyltransferase involved in cell wall biosynthesis